MSLCAFPADLFLCVYLVYISSNNINNKKIELKIWHLSLEAFKTDSIFDYRELTIHKVQTEKVNSSVTRSNDLLANRNEKLCRPFFIMNYAMKQEKKERFRAEIRLWKAQSRKLNMLGWVCLAEFILMFSIKKRFFFHFILGSVLCYCIFHPLLNLSNRISFDWFYFLDSFR